MIGKQFSRWTVIGKSSPYISPKDKWTVHQQWLCRCSCGTEKAVSHHTLLKGKSRSCGCLRREVSRAANTKHGHGARGRVARAYITWARMISRCCNSRDRQWGDYGGRGISVCDSWRKYENFFADMGDRPHGKSLDRINVNGNYEPSNCRWITQKEQMRNTRANRVVEYGGEAMSLAEACERAELPYGTVFARIKYRGWDVGRALSTPVQR